VLCIGNAIPGTTDMASDGLEVICSIDGLVSWECSYHLLWMFSAIHDSIDVHGEILTPGVICLCWQIPINQCPFAKVQTYARDGQMNVTDNGGSKPNYYPNSFEDLPRPDASEPDVHPYK
jgi:hypothetical protein